MPPTEADRPDDRSPDRATPFYRVCRLIVRGVATVGFDLRAYGVERVPRRGGVLIVANHQSFLDPPFIGLPLARPVAFLAKSELFESKLFGGAIRRLNAFPVRQGAGDIGAMRESVRLLKAGWALTIFPEGSRTFDGGLQPAQKGAGLLVKKADVPVVPAVIDGTFDAWPRGAKVPRPSPVRVLFGEPENLSGFKSDAIRQWVDERLAKLMAELRSR